MYSQKNKRRKTSQDIKGFFLLLVALVLISLGIFVYYSAKSKIVPFDNSTLCPTGGPQSITAVLIDKSDPVSVVQSATIKQYLLDLKNEIGKYGLLQIYVVDEVEDSLIKSVFNVCNPGRGNEINPLVGNPVKVERIWRKRYSDNLDKTIQTLLENNERKNSPIIESIQSVNASSFIGKDKSDMPKKLIIISDMIQHTEILNQYTENFTFEKFKGSPNFRKAKINLENVEIKIAYIRRETKQNVQGAKHIEFWQSFFAFMGGKVIDVQSIN